MTYSFRQYLRGVFYSLPVQLLFLHFRKYQVMLAFWLLLFSVVNSSFMKSFGANSLFLAPEYLGSVNALGTAIVGISVGVFIMCWNITTFILFSRHFTFLAATRFPFLKYCINNSALPLSFLIFYMIKAYQHAHYKELPWLMVTLTIQVEVVHPLSIVHCTIDSPILKIPLASLPIPFLVVAPLI